MKKPEEMTQLRAFVSKALADARAEPVRADLRLWWEAVRAPRLEVRLRSLWERQV